MSFITDLFSGNAPTVVDNIGNVISKVNTANGDKMTMDDEIVKAEFSHDEAMASINLEDKKTDDADTDSARKMNESIESSITASWLSKNIVPLMALIFTFLCFSVFFIVLGALLNFGPLKDAKLDPVSKDVLIYLLGTLTTIVVTIVSFYFGSSHGSSQKNDIIERLKTGQKNS